MEIMKTKKSCQLIVSMLLTTMFCTGQAVNINYFGQFDPGKTVTRFAPGIVSKSGVADFYVSFSPNGNKMFYGNANKRLYAEYKNGSWHSFEDYVAPEGYKSAVFSPVQDLIYVWEGAELKIGFMVKDGNKWSEVTEVIGPGNQKAWPSASKDSMLYYLGNNFTVYSTKFNGITHETPKPLPFPVNYSSRFNPNDVCISAEGDYLVFINDVHQPGASAGAGMFVSFKKEENHWTNPKRVSDYYLKKEPIPYFGQRTKMSPDGKYMFAAHYPQNHDMDIYWVSTSIFEDARKSNFIPYVRNYIPNMEVAFGKFFSFTIADSIFVDDDGNETLTLTASLSNGKALPDSLTFDSNTNTLSGNLYKTGSYTIKITATDTARASISDVFKIIVKESTSVRVKINNSEVLIYPNPVQNTIQIKQPKGLTDCNFKLINLQGKALNKIG